MKILLTKDVPKLGRAGEIKKVANGFGRNYLIPQGYAVLATPGAMKQVESITERANLERAALNNELGSVADVLQGKRFTFAVRASQTGRLYGSVTTRAIAEMVHEVLEIEISHRAIESEPLRSLGRYTVPVRLTFDLIPTIEVIVHREGESVEAFLEAEAVAEAEAEAQEAAAEAFYEEELEAELEEEAEEEAE